MNNKPQLKLSYLLYLYPSMEFFFIFLISLSLAFFIKSLIQNTTRNHSKLPPGPPTFAILLNLQFLRNPFSELELVLRKLRFIYGPTVSLNIGHWRTIFITTSDLAHQALIHNGSHLAGRPPAPPTIKIFTSNQHNITSAPYGPLWRLLRRNLSAELLHPSRVKAFAHARKLVLDILKHNLRSESGSGRSDNAVNTLSLQSDHDTHPYENGLIPGSETDNSGTGSGRTVCVMEHFHFAMFCLLMLMCFGEKYDENAIKEIEKVQKSVLLSFSRFNILNVLPNLGKILFRKRWNEVLKLRKMQEDVLLPLIRARHEKKQTDVVAYVDTLLNLTLPEEGGRKLNADEMVSLCSEFLNAGTDTTSTALLWIMAQLVKRQDIQSKLYAEVKQVATIDSEIKEEDLAKLSYLKAVVLEGLRRHPPGHFVLPHVVTEDIQLDKYAIPKDAIMNFIVSEIGWDPKNWEDPMEFKPERFLGKGEGFDVTGSKEIKMMPFGAGRRICPGLGLAMMHLEYFVANLIMEFEWTTENGDYVDLSEKQEFSTVMRNPLRAHVSPRLK